MRLNVAWFFIALSASIARGQGISPTELLQRHQAAAARLPSQALAANVETEVNDSSQSGPHWNRSSLKFRNDGARQELLVDEELQLPSRTARAGVANRHAQFLWD